MFILAYSVFSTTDPRVSGTTQLLQVLKHGCIGVYLFLESCTILHAMSIHRTPWAGPLLIEANRFWFYSLSCSILLTLFSLHQSSPANPTNLREKPSTSTSPPKFQTPQTQHIKRLTTDLADILTPGYVIGWIDTNPVLVATGAALSSMLGASEILERVTKE